MSQLSAFISCNAVQTSLMEAWAFDNNKLGNVSLTKFILSDVNRSDFLQRNINFRAGGYKSVEVIYDQRFLENTVSDVGRISCTTFSADGETSQVYDIDPLVGASRGFSLTAEEVETRCQDDASYISKRVLKLMNVILEKIETDAFVSAHANIGNFADTGTTTAKTGATKTSTGAIVTEMLEEVSFQTRNNEWTVMPYVFGGRAWDNYRAALNAACCGDLGIDAQVYDMQNKYNFMYTYKADSELPTDTALAIIPGTIQMITFNELENPTLAMNDDALKQGTIIYPNATLLGGKGLKFDYRAEYRCTDGTGVKRWHFQVALAYDFVYLPDDMYQASDRLNGVNGINEYQIVNPYTA